jgi:protein-disulfide isomerase
VYKNFVVHPQTATLPALAACAAGAQGKFAEMEHELWEQGFTKGGFSEELVNKLAKDLKLDEKKFQAELKGERCQNLLKTDMAQLGKLGVSGTPAFYINGRFLGGAQPIEAFKKVVDEELKKAEEKVAAGTPADQYYQKFVVEAGVKELEAPKAEGGK